MIELGQVFNLIGILNNDEKKSILNKFKKSDLKDIENKLILHVLNDLNLDFETLCSKYEGEFSKEAVKKQVYRLVEKIYDVLLNRESIRNNSFYDKRAKDIFNLLSYLMLSDILAYRGLSKLSEKILDKVTEESRFYEHFDILSYCLSKKLNRRYLERPVVLSLENQIKSVQRNSLAYSKMVNIHFKYLNLDSIISRNDSFHSIDKDFNLALKISAKSESSLIELYFRFINLQYLFLKGKFELGVEKSYEMLDYLSDRVNIQSSIRFINVYLFNSLFLRYDFSFSRSLSSLDNLQKHFKNSDVNDYIYREKYFLNYLFMNELTKAKYYFNSIKNLEFNFNKYYLNYYRYCIDYIQKREKSDLEQITYPNDSYGLLVVIGIRILQIMMYLDRGNTDLADNSIENLRKYLGKKTYSGKIEPRLKNTMELLWVCRKESYNYKLITQKYSKLLDSFYESESVWVPHSYELIIFEEWLLSKAQGKDYNHGEIMAKMKRKYMDRKSASSLMLA